MISKFKKIIPIEYKVKALLNLYKFKSIDKFSFKIRKNNEKQVFIFLAADYGNLGDVAITYAQHKFLQENYPNHRVTEIPISKTIEGVAFVKRTILKNDIITTVGGGNMGDLYPIIEIFRQTVINNFRENKIISFPQTIDFHETPKGQKALKKAIKVYSKHPDLTLLAREQKSFDFFNLNFSKNKIFMVPDIVMTLDKTKPERHRKGVLVCLRDDKEKNLTDAQEITLMNIINENFASKSTRDTHIGGEHLSLFNRVKALDHIWDDFRKAEIVFTDRLHGMIFCFITNTPAIVFLNNNHKIQSSFHWLKKAKHIHLMEMFSEKDINESIQFLKSQNYSIEKENLMLKYTDLKKVI